jgi:hypothetical protein
MPRAACLAALLALVAAGTPARAQEAQAPSYRGFNANIGAGGAGGDFSSILKTPVSGEFNYFRQSGSGKWRIGAGVNYGSFLMEEPYEDEPEWGSLQIYAYGQRMLRTKGALRPYIQVRLGTARLHPRSELFEVHPPPEDLEPGESKTKAANGFQVGIVPGLELRVSRAAYLDASLRWTYFSVEDYDLGPVNQPPAGSGSTWEARIGATWFPNAEQRGEGASGGVRDAWGVQRSFGWAIGEAMSINFVASITTEYIRKVNFSQISPRSWWHNIEDGFYYDDNEFKTNQYVHPFNGAAYYNSGRANGLNYWASSAVAAFGAFQWECCGETHPMSFNDMISTGIGGIALGEAQYRLSSEILNNQSRGMGRFWR